jgi:hypothetical protein
MTEGVSAIHTFVIQCPRYALAERHPRPKSWPPKADRTVRILRLHQSLSAAAPPTVHSGAPTEDLGTYNAGPYLPNRAKLHDPGCTTNMAKDIPEADTVSATAPTTRGGLAADFTVRRAIPPVSPAYEPDEPRLHDPGTMARPPRPLSDHRPPAKVEVECGGHHSLPSARLSVLWRLQRNSVVTGGLSPHQSHNNPRRAPV